MDYSVLFIQFANKEIDTKGEMPALTVTKGDNGNMVLTLLREGLKKQMSVAVPGVKDF